MMAVLACLGCQGNKKAPKPDAEDAPKQASKETPPAKESVDTSSVEPTTLFQRLANSRTGIEFQNSIVETNAHNILTYSYMYNGGGVAIGDINNDQLLDIVFTSNQGSNRLYLNLGDLKFKDISDSSGFGSSRGWHTGVNMHDVNGDGFLDIYICRSGPGTNTDDRKNLLFINDGKLAFKEQANEYGIADSNHSTQASFFDYDQDGDQDLYVMNHPVFFGFVSVKDVLERVKDPQVAKENSDTLYRNNGDGTFSAVSGEAGVANLGYGLGLVTADLNNDGWTDIYVANDFSTPDFMYINQKDGTFLDEIKQRSGHISYFGMGCDVVDVNCDLNPDIIEMDMTAQDRVRSKTLMPSMSSERFWGLVSVLNYHYQYMFNSLQLNQGDGYFSEIAQLSGIAKTDWSWAVLGSDFNLDGWDDLLITNGFRRDSKNNDFLSRFHRARSKFGGRQQMIEQNAMMQWVEQIPSQKLQNYLFQNNQDLTFSNKSTDWGLHHETFSNGAAYGDLDNDGDLDLVINNIDDFAFLYQNRSEKLFPDRNSLSVQPIDQNGIPLLNTKVTVETANHSQMKELLTCRGFQSAVSPVLHFGLGAAAVATRITFQWPDGTTTEMTGVKAGQVVRIKQPDSSTPIVRAQHKPLLNEINDIPFQHIENQHDEYQKEILLPHSQSSLGPCLATADVNGDGLEDVFVGGSRACKANLFLQNPDGSFKAAESQPWHEHEQTENVDAVFFDCDGDQDLDLYIVNGGGSEFVPGDYRFRDLLFQNNDGEFEELSLPKIASSNAVAVPIDYDNDGDLDLFVGARVTPGKYPVAPSSYLLKNDAGNFERATDVRGLGNLGMINDSVATDFNNDGLTDLIVVGEWTSIIFLQNTKNGFKRTAMEGTEAMNGWWFSITELDINADGRKDFLLGNIGKNNKFQSKGPVQLRVLGNDFDQNGSFDIVLAKDENGRSFPVRGRECSTEQMPFIGAKFDTYQDFAVADLQNILGQDKIDESLKLEVNTFANCLLIGQEQGFKRVELPSLGQIAPIRDAIVVDLNHDGHQDVITVGNLYNVEVETVRYDAGMGQVLLGDGKGSLTPQLSSESGFQVRSDSRRLVVVKTKTGNKVIVASNNDWLKMFQTVLPAN